MITTFFLLAVICFVLGIWYGHSKADPVQCLINDAKMIGAKIVEACKRIAKYFTERKSPFSKRVDPLAAIFLSTMGLLMLSMVSAFVYRCII